VWFICNILYSWLIIKPFSFRLNLSLPIRFDAMETLESYQLTKSDYYTHAWDLPPQLGGCVSEAGSLPFMSAINGKEPGSWHFPLSANNGGLEPDWLFCGDEGAAKREAVERVSANSNAIVAFASRGAGQQG
jgi:glutathione S-transferase